MKNYIVTLIIDLMDALGTPKTLSHTSLAVMATSPSNASIAAVSYFGDNSPVSHVRKCSHSQDVHDYLGETGHMIFDGDSRIRYTSVRATQVNEGEINTFLAITVGLKNGVTVKGL